MSFKQYFFTSANKMNADRKKIDSSDETELFFHDVK